MKINVLHVYRTYFPDPPGGVQEAIRQIALATNAHEIESRIFSLSPKPIPREIDRLEGRVIRSRSWFSPASCDLGGIDSLLSFREAAGWADVIQYHFPWPFADILHFLGNTDKPSVLTYHSDIVRQRVLGPLYSPLMNRMLRSMSAVVATSPTYAMTSPALNSKVLPDRLKTIPLGIADCRDLEVDSVIELKLLNRCFVSSRPFVLALGAMRYYKGFHTLIEAASEIDGAIVIAGSGPEELKLKNLAAEKGVSNVIFAGQISDEEKITLLRHCSVFVLPSHLRSEAFGMVLVEASMFGKPMVCCEIGSGTSYVNKHDETGFVVPPESPGRFAKAVNALLSNELLAAQMGLAARQRYERLFSSAALGRAYSALYREVANPVVLG